MAFAENFGKLVSGAAETAALIAKTVSSVILLHHNDTDGLASGVILKKAFERAQIPCRQYCLERLYPIVLERLFNDSSLEPSVGFVIADFGSGLLPEISRINHSRYHVFVVDHHSLSPAADAKIHVFNCLQYGIPGYKECSASAMSYLFARALGKHNTDLSCLGVLGALGDGFIDASGRLTGVNAEVLKDAERAGLVNFNDGYLIQLGSLYTARDLVSYIDALGSFQYLEGGPDIAMKGLSNGFDSTCVAYAVKARERFEKELSGFTKKIQLFETKNIQWFKLGKWFEGMGVKTVGLISQFLKDSDLVNPKKYLAGFQTVPSMIPGLGDFKFEDVKISMRVPSPLWAEVERGRSPALTEFLPQATSDLGGVVDACHRHSAATTVKAGSEEMLIDRMQEIIDETLSKP